LSPNEASSIPYSPSKADLYLPAQRGNFFPPDQSTSEAAVCAEMSRLASRLDPYFGFDTNKIEKVILRIGFTMVKFFESKGTPNGSGTHCFLAQQEDTLNKRHLAVLAFRGTDSGDPSDLVDDADLIPKTWERGGEVHSGFAEALAHVRPDLDAALQNVSSRILITGHSLGAAMATLMASVLGPSAGSRLSLYTFGSPRVGNAAFVDTLKGIDNHRYVDCCDLVTRVPPETFGYQHVGDPFYIDSKGNVSFNPEDAFIARDRIGAAEEYLLNFGWRTGNVAVRELADHAPINYVRAVAAVGQQTAAAGKMF